MKKKIPAWANGAALSLCEILIAILLLINPEKFTRGIIVCAGVVLTVLGIVSTIGYFRKPPAEAAQQHNLAKGLCLVGSGLFCALNSQWFLITFSALSVLYGVAILLLGVVRVQWMVDDIRLKTGKWQWAAGSAALTLIIAAIILSNPFAAPRMIWYFVGIGLLAQAALDITAIVLTNKKPKGKVEPTQATPQTPQQK